MDALPRGIVTLLFTDIEGSTRLLDHLDARYGEVLATHHHLLRDAFEAHGGRVIDTQGDACFAVFTRAHDAVAAAVAAQRALAQHPWPQDGVVRVRMGLHTGEPTVAGPTYIGMDVHRAARLCAAGHGGQVLLSEATYAQVVHALPAGLSLRSLGRHRLKDLRHPEHIYQLVISGLPADFPALRTLERRRHNLPVQATTLIGREREIAAVRQQLLRPEIHLLTLTGAGGTGKTRLALEVAAELLDAFEDGVYFVPLAPIRDPPLVASTMAQALELREAPGLSPLDSVKGWLRDKQILLVLDNFEQLLPAAPQVSELVAACPRLKVLVTSRSALHLYGEHDFPVAPLSQSDAVRLFIERARAVKPDFTITDENAPAVAEICARLEGLPLATELAAARIRVLSPTALLARLDRRLPLLTSGPQDLPKRQRTLRAAIAWSYDLLNEGERMLFRRLAPFVGGFTCEAADAVCNVPATLPLDLLDGLEALVSHSLVQQTAEGAGEPRFQMLETIREYALEQLEDSGEAAAVRRHHARYFLEYAEEASRRGNLMARQARLWRELDNLRAALTWALQHDETDLLVRLVGTLGEFWYFASLLREGQSWLQEALARGQAAPPERQAPLLYWDARIAYRRNDHARARANYEACLPLQRQIGDLAGVALTLHGLGALMLGRDLQQAAALLGESVALRRAHNLREGFALAVALLGLTALLQGDVERALALTEEGVTAGQESDDPYGTAIALSLVAFTELKRNNPARALRLNQQALRLAQALNDPWHVAQCFVQNGEAASAAGQPRRAARLFGAAEAALERMGSQLWPPFFLLGHERYVAAAREHLGEEAFAAAWAEGRALSWEQAIAYALAESEAGYGSLSAT
ncbi:MAG: adenylate/guanylate cyclase domain-containing protein [Chloroflexi bacterium]|nr:adenylate/guanylate cyclase domain-containing protein [Chloroflexota bacterium]